MMKRLLILALALVCASSVLAQGYTIETVPNVQLSDASRFTSNPDGILSGAAVSEIDRMCGDLRGRGLAEVVVLVLEQVETDQLDMFAHNVLNKWGVGQKGKDNGLVISVVRSQRDIQFETGYGLEGVLPDALCKRIQTVYMADALREGNFDKGVLDGVTAVYNVLTDNQAELTALKAHDDEGNLLVNGMRFFGVMVILFIVLMAIAIVAAARRNKRGGGRGDNFGSGSGDPGAGTFRGPDAGAIIGGILGGLLGGGFGGGGFGGGGGSFGGGFGGGRSGGGGARTGF